MPKQSELAKESFLNLFSDRKSIPYDEFINWALYDPQIGYYSSSKIRVGKSSKSDFYTSTNLKPVWGDLLVEAICTILGNQDPSQFEFIEIAPEPGINSLDKTSHPFKATRSIRLGEQIELSSASIIFANEWLDAQPFKRFRFNTKLTKWDEIGVSLVDGFWNEVPLEHPTPNQKISINLPNHYKVPYTIDWPVGAENALNHVLTQDWHGLFLTFDYGMDVQRILNDFPEGTSRTYHNHQQTNNILKNPGSQDITCHICWNPLRELLENHDFSKVELQSQESFFMNLSQNTIKQILEQPPMREKHIGALKELIHPQHLGQKFQALHGTRRANP
jgi:SAM-dependent MidA family methyltransferase